MIRLPPQAVQRAIAAFLNRETAKIDALIEKKRRLLDLLDEKRTALITRAVTRGLDPDVPLKDTGVEWLGKIPAHWECQRFGRLVKQLDQGWSPVADDRRIEGAEWGVLKLSAIHRGQFRAYEHKTLGSGHKFDRTLRLRTGDLLISRANTPELVGDACIVEGSDQPLIPSDLIFRLRLEEDSVAAGYLLYWLLSDPHRTQLQIDARGSSQSMVKISQRHVRAWQVPTPPRGEQIAILTEINEQVSEQNRTAFAIHHAIALLQEYRTALISAAVTGKLDIPVSAA